MQSIDEPDHTSSKQQKQRRFPPRPLWLFIVLFIAISLRIVLYFSQDIGDRSAQYTFISTSLLNVLIFAAIVAQAIIYYAQWTVMNESLFETRKAAEAAKASADTLINSERAWLSVIFPPVPLPSPFDPDKDTFFWLCPTIKNNGRTVAQITRIRLRVHRVRRSDFQPPGNPPRYPNPDKPEPNRIL